MPSQPIDSVDRILPTPVQALPDKLSKYNKELLPIDRHLCVARLSTGDTMVHSISKRQRVKRRPGCLRRPGYRVDRRLDATTPGSGITKVRTSTKCSRKKRPSGYGVDKASEKLLMQKFGDVISALSNVRTIMTHLAGIQMAQPVGLRRKVEGLEDIAVQTVIDPANALLSANRRTAIPKALSELENLVQNVSKISLRNGHDFGSQEQGRRLLEKLDSSCDGLAQELERLSVEQKAAEGETVMDLCDA